MDFEEELDFNEDEHADLSEYSQNFEWNEAVYMRFGLQLLGTMRPGDIGMMHMPMS